MKYLAVLLMLLVLPAAFADPIHFTGYIDVATPSFSVGNVTKVNLASYIPKGTQNVAVTVFNGSLSINNTDDLVAGTIYNGEYVASGTTLKFTGFDPEQKIPIDFYALCNETGATATVKLRCWRGNLP